VGKLKKMGYNVRYFILGEGPMENELKELATKEGVSDYVTLLGYQTNPYKYVAKCDLFVCSSFAEGFSTAATEALIVSTPVCTTEVSGMKEMLGENNEWGVVTENTDEALYEGIKKLVSDPELLAHYKEKAAERGKFFTTDGTVNATEKFLLD
jgi:glycosyltransferase involved in cell wall biosynthesis